MLIIGVVGRRTIVVRTSIHFANIMNTTITAENIPLKKLSGLFFSNTCRKLS